MASNSKKKTSQSQQRGTEKIREARRQAEAKKRKRNIIYGAISVVFIFAIIVLWKMIPQVTNTSSTTGDNSTSGNGNFDAVLVTDYYEDGKQYYADIVIKDYGTITVELDADAAPITVENFVNLASSGFYDGLTFHRIISGFMMQGGSSDGLGYTGSSETIYGEFASNGWDQNTIKHQRGVISMARSSDPNSASSQFFIMHATSTHLDGDYAAFGYVIEGIDVVDAVCENARPTDGNGSIAAADQPIIETITVYTKD